MDAINCTKKIAQRLSTKERRGNLRNQQGLICKINSKTNVLELSNVQKTIGLKRTDSTCKSTSNSVSFQRASTDLWEEQTSCNPLYYKFIQLIDDKDLSLIHGYIRREAIKKIN